MWLDYLSVLPYQRAGQVRLYRVSMEIKYWSADPRARLPARGRLCTRGVAVEIYRWKCNDGYICGGRRGLGVLVFEDFVRSIGVGGLEDFDFSAVLLGRLRLFEYVAKK